MKIRNLLGAVCASAVLAACGGGGGGDTVFVGPSLTAISATLSGTTNSQVLVGFDANNNLILQLPDGDIATFAPGTGGSQAVDPRLDGLLVTRVGSDQGDTIEIVQSTDFFLIRIDDVDTLRSNFEAYAAFGNETTSLPTGSATYDGRFLVSGYSGGTVPDAEDLADSVFSDSYGSANVIANFDSSDVDVTLTFDAVNPPALANGVLTGTGLGISGAQYSGAISGTVNAFNMQGELIGAFYGPNAAQTAGTFTAEDLTANVEIVGGYGANLTSSTP